MADESSKDTKQPDYSVKCMFFFKRKPDLSAEQCWEHWRNVHAGLCVPWLAHHNFTEYQQVELQAKIAPGDEKHPAERTEFDGIAVFEAPSFDALGAAFNDPFWKDVIAKDVGNFTDQKGLYENGIVAQYTGRMTVPIRNGKGTIEAEEGYRLWKEYHAKPKEEIGST